jgi:hypothetical protein
MEMIIGSNSGFENCLEIMRKIGVNVFCKLDGIYQFDSQPKKLVNV